MAAHVGHRKHTRHVGETNPTNMCTACCRPAQEMNDHEQRCRFLQVWLTPDRRGHTPQYGSSSYGPADRHNQLLHVLSGVGPAPAWQGVNCKGCIKLHADANVFVSENDAGVSYQLELGPSRQAYLVCMEGEELFLQQRTIVLV